MADAEMEAMDSDLDSWDAVSARGPAESDGEDDLYYIPEARPDLGPFPMDTANPWVQSTDSHENRLK